MKNPLPYISNRWELHLQEKDGYINKGDTLFIIYCGDDNATNLSYTYTYDTDTMCCRVARGIFPESDIIRSLHVALTLEQATRILGEEGLFQATMADNVLGELEANIDKTISTIPHHRYTEFALSVESRLWTCVDGTRKLCNKPAIVRR